MTRSFNSRKGRRNAAPSRVLCSCHSPDCDVKCDRGKKKRKEGRRLKHAKDVMRVIIFAANLVSIMKW